MRILLTAIMTLTLLACQSAYYGAAEKVGYHKRDILVDRINDTKEAQEEAGEEFQSALEQLQRMVNFDGGNLEDIYDDMVDVWEGSTAAAEQVSQRIDGVDHVANSLFAEWEDEIEQYSSARLKSDSKAKLRDTRSRYGGMIKAMRKSEAKMEPVLTALNDNVLYLKHNLNAQAIASLKTEFGRIEGDIKSLIKEMENAIATSDAFIASMQ